MPSRPARQRQPDDAARAAAADPDRPRDGEPERPRAVTTRIAPNGTVIHLVAGRPDHLPAVQGRDIATAWDAAHGHSNPSHTSPGSVRVFRFRAADGSTTDIAIADRDARAWASAIDRSFGLTGPYAVSLCFRLIALVDLLASSRYLSRHVTRGHGDLPASLFRAAANLPLDAAGRFDDAGFATLLGLVPPATGTAR